MIDHTGVSVSDFAKSIAWYKNALAPFGYALLKEVPTSLTGGARVAGFGDTATQEPDFWITAAAGRPATTPPMHVAFRVQSCALVAAFHAAALSAGGTDNGAPGLRSHYHSHYYSAFVRDPDGHNVEAVCHKGG